MSKSDFCFVPESLPPARLLHCTPWSTNVSNICRSAGLAVGRIERNWRYLVTLAEGSSKEDCSKKVNDSLTVLLLVWLFCP